MPTVNNFNGFRQSVNGKLFLYLVDLVNPKIELNLSQTSCNK